MSKDYYKILGVSETCSEYELKSAYRRLARKWHPDIAGDTAAHKFKEINEAYEVLSDKNKRAEYDTMNRFYNYSSCKKSTTTTGNSTKPNFDNSKKERKKNSGIKFNWEEFIAKYQEYTKNFDSKNNSKNDNYVNPQNGKDINTDVEITIAEAIKGTSKIINMLQTHICTKCNGRQFINGTKCPYCKGKGEQSDYRKFTVKIPAGINDNSKIRLAGEGEKGINGGRNGDLYITVHIKSPIDYKTEGNNIIKKIVLAPYEAVLGGTFTVKTFDGNITIKLSPNTLNGQKIRLSGCGLNLNGKIGDMILTVEIQIPRNLSNQEIELYKKLQELSSQNIK